MDLTYLNDRLSRAGVKFDAGLSSGELQSIERRWGFLFPPDLRDFLRDALPVSKGWIDWRKASDPEIQDRLNWPFQGMCFDIEHSSFWLPRWGEKPSDMARAFKVARVAVEEAPKLIPVYGHRYIPDRPHESGNPIFSVYQTDLICYGANLIDYLCNEFPAEFGRTGFIAPCLVRRIEFWSDIVDL
jgi:hypothetical protein